MGGLPRYLGGFERRGRRRAPGLGGVWERSNSGGGGWGFRFRAAGLEWGLEFRGFGLRV